MLQPHLDLSSGHLGLGLGHTFMLAYSPDSFSISSKSARATRIRPSKSITYSRFKIAIASSIACNSSLLGSDQAYPYINRKQQP